MSVINSFDSKMCVTDGREEKHKYHDVIVAKKKRDVACYAK
jgi:hypothetical protein